MIHDIEDWEKFLEWQAASENDSELVLKKHDASYTSQFEFLYLRELMYHQCLVTNLSMQAWKAMETPVTWFVLPDGRYKVYVTSGKDELRQIYDAGVTLILLGNSCFGVMYCGARLQIRPSLV